MTVLACGTCVTDGFEYLLPPVGLWMLISVSWYLCSGGVLSLFKEKLAFQPGILKSLFFVGAALFASAFAGPFFFLLLGILPVLGCLALAIPRFSRHCTPRFRRVFLLVAAVHFIAIAFAAGITVQRLKTRTDAEFLVQRSSSTPTGQNILKNMRRREPQSLDEYRHVVKNGRYSYVIESAQRIAAISNDPADIDLVESVLRQHSFWISETEKNALKQSLEKFKTRLSK
jgi:hypothetical protein